MIKMYETLSDFHSLNVGNEIKWGKIQSVNQKCLVQKFKQCKNTSYQFVLRPKSKINKNVKKPYQHKVIGFTNVVNRYALTSRQHLKLLAEPKHLAYDPHCFKIIAVPQAQCSPRLIQLSLPNKERLIQNLITYKEHLTIRHIDNLHNSIKNPNFGLTLSQANIYFKHLNKIQKKRQQRKKLKHIDEYKKCKHQLTNEALLLSTKICCQLLFCRGRKHLNDISKRIAAFILDILVISKTLKHIPKLISHNNSYGFEDALYNAAYFVDIVLQKVNKIRPASYEQYVSSESSKESILQVEKLKSSTETDETEYDESEDEEERGDTLDIWDSDLSDIISESKFSDSSEIIKEFLKHKVKMNAMRNIKDNNDYQRSIVKQQLQAYIKQSHQKSSQESFDEHTKDRRRTKRKTKKQKSDSSDISDTTTDNENRRKKTGKKQKTKKQMKEQKSDDETSDEEDQNEDTIVKESKKHKTSTKKQKTNKEQRSDDKVELDEKRSVTESERHRKVSPKAYKSLQKSEDMISDEVSSIDNKTENNSITKNHATEDNSKKTSVTENEDLRKISKSQGIETTDKNTKDEDYLMEDEIDTAKDRDETNKIETKTSHKSSLEIIKAENLNDNAISVDGRLSDETNKIDNVLDVSKSTENKDRKSLEKITPNDSKTASKRSSNSKVSITESKKTDNNKKPSDTETKNETLQNVSQIKSDTGGSKLTIEKKLNDVNLESADLSAKASIKSDKVDHDQIVQHVESVRQDIFEEMKQEALVQYAETGLTDSKHRTVEKLVEILHKYYAIAPSKEKLNVFSSDPQLPQVELEKMINNIENIMIEDDELIHKYKRLQMAYYNKLFRYVMEKSPDNMDTRMQRVIFILSKKLAEKTIPLSQLEQNVMSLNISDVSFTTKLKLTHSSSLQAKHPENIDSEIERDLLTELSIHEQIEEDDPVYVDKESEGRDVLEEIEDDKLYEEDFIEDEEFGEGDEYESRANEEEQYEEKESKPIESEKTSQQQIALISKKQDKTESIKSVQSGLKVISTDQLDIKHDLEIFPHKPGVICCTALKCWAKFIEQVTENAKYWCTWINQTVSKLSYISSIIRGDLYNDFGELVEFNPIKWKYFVRKLNDDIIHWRHYNQHISELTQQILVNYNTEYTVECCPLCTHEQTDFANMNTQHICVELIQGIKTMECWRQWLNTMVAETSAVSLYYTEKTLFLVESVQSMDFVHKNRSIESTDSCFGSFYSLELIETICEAKLQKFLQK